MDAPFSTSGKCARDVWKALNLEEEITRACSEDKSGSVTLEHLVCAKPVPVQPEELALPGGGRNMV
jgi:hypothetical protein